MLDFSWKTRRAGIILVYFHCVCVDIIKVDVTLIACDSVELIMFAPILCKGHFMLLSPEVPGLF